MVQANNVLVYIVLNSELNSLSCGAELAGIENVLC